jgi:multicomponent Na+:H+ antiporter subunit F
MSPFYQLIGLLIFVMTVSLLLCFVRLYLGPDVPNRTVAFDAIAVHTVGIIALFSVRNSSEALLDVAIVTLVLGFLGTLMLARYLEKADEEGWIEIQETDPRDKTE